MSLYSIMEYTNRYDADPKTDGIQLSKSSLTPNCKQTCTEEDFDYLADPAYDLIYYSPQDRIKILRSITAYEDRSTTEIFKDMKDILIKRLGSGWNQTAKRDYKLLQKPDGSEVWCHKRKPNGPCSNELSGPYIELIHNKDGTTSWCAPFIYCLTAKNMKDTIAFQADRVDEVKALILDIERFIKLK